MLFMMNNKAFTLLEIIVVIIIVGIISSFAIPRFNGTVERVRAAEGVQLLTALLGGQRIFAAENGGGYTTNLNNLDVTIPQADNFNLPPTVLDPGNPVTSPIARIRRTNGYDLEINERGDIRCQNVTGASITCAQANISTSF